MLVISQQEEKSIYCELILFAYQSRNPSIWFGFNPSQTWLEFDQLIIRCNIRVVFKKLVAKYAEIKSTDCDEPPSLAMNGIFSIWLTAKSYLTYNCEKRKISHSLRVEKLLGPITKARAYRWWTGGERACGVWRRQTTTGRARATPRRWASGAGAAGGDCDSHSPTTRPSAVGASCHPWGRSAPCQSSTAAAGWI